jgi:hypothetical protein
MDEELNFQHPRYGIRHVDECPAMQGGACQCNYERTLAKLNFFNNLGPDPDIE